MIPYKKISLISEKEHNKVWLASAKDSDIIVVVKEISHANTDVLACIASINNPHIPHILLMETADHVTTIPDLGKTVDSKYYTIDSKNKYITFEKSFFKWLKYYTADLPQSDQTANRQ